MEKGNNKGLENACMHRGIFFSHHMSLAFLVISCFFFRRSVKKFLEKNNTNILRLLIIIHLR